jgi:hypothetical protein
MKIKYTETVEREQEIELPYYFIGRFGHQSKAYEFYYITLDAEEVIRIHQRDLSEYIDIKFLNNQEELKEKFENHLSKIIKRFNNAV